MLDPAAILADSESLRAALARKGERVDLDAILALEAERLLLNERFEALSAERRRRAARVAKLPADRRRESPKVAELRRLRAEIQDLRRQLRATQAAVRDESLRIPNPPDPGAPNGADETVRTWGTERPAAGGARGALTVSPRDARWPAFSRLARAVTNFLLDLHAEEHGFTEVRLPSLVRAKALEDVGRLPRMKAGMYGTTEPDLFLSPSLEAPLTALLAGRTLRADELPVRWVAAGPCFRRETGSAGRENRGVLRAHEYDTVFLLRADRPTESPRAAEAMTGLVETALRRLELPYRVRDVCAGRLSFASRRCYDVEARTSGGWLKVSSVREYGDFQTRRAGARLREADGSLRFCHTVNGAGPTVWRTVAALLDHHGRPDDGFDAPRALRPYLETTSRPKRPR